MCDFIFSLSIMILQDTLKLSKVSKRRVVRGEDVFVFVFDLTKKSRKVRS